MSKVGPTGSEPGPAGPAGAPGGHGWRQAPLVAVLTVLAVGLLAVTAHAWRHGAQIIGGALVLGAGLRIALPARRAGLLVVRGRAFDATVLLGLGLALVALATSIPTS